jgi:hypothetical protein
LITCLSSCNVSNGATESQRYSWVDTDTTLALYDQEAILWQYNFNTQKVKSYFHPINLNKTPITALSPEDHPWHLGLWFSWKYINGVNYWEYDQSEGIVPWNYAGVTSINHKTVTKRSDYAATIELDLSYHERGQPDVLAEKRIITVSKPSDNGLFYIDYTFIFTAIADTVELNRTPLAHEEHGETYGGYAGLSLRFSTDLTDPYFINPDQTNTMKHGKNFDWMYYGFHNEKGASIGTAIFDHPDNPNHPSAWHLTNTPETPLYFLQPAPLFHQPITLYAEERLTLKYRVQFFGGNASIHGLEKDFAMYSVLVADSLK